MIFDIFMLDLWIYWWHRAVHKSDFLWRFHKIHHLDETMDMSNALRFHFGEVLMSAAVRALVIIALSIPFWHVVVFESIVFCCALFHHGNIRLPKQVEAVTGKIIVTPNHHWVHHHPKGNDLNRNFGTLFSFWDSIFRSKSKTARKPNMPIGVPGEGDKSLIALLLSPFKKQV